MRLLKDDAVPSVFPHVAPQSEHARDRGDRLHRRKRRWDPDETDPEEIDLSE
jgi:hypothetical protein